MQRALLRKRKVGSKVYLFSMPEVRQVFKKEKFCFFSLPACHWEPPSRPPPLTSRLGFKVLFVLV